LETRGRTHEGTASVRNTVWMLTDRIHPLVTEAGDEK
jgi:hypothetical protein